MRIMSARVTSYKSVSDSGEFTLEPDVTCLVGKNESGKTAVLEAMYRLNPLPTGHPETFEELRDYPRRYRSRDQHAIPETRVVTLTVELDDDDVTAIAKSSARNKMSAAWARCSSWPLVWVTSSAC